MNAQDLKNSILQLAIQGKLVEQREKEGAAVELYQQIQEEKGKLIKEGKIKKSKALPEIAEDDIPFDIPENWKWVRLGMIVSILGDGIHGTPLYDDKGNYYFINGNNLNNGKIEFKVNTKRVKEDQFIQHKRVLNESTVLVSINGTIGNVAFYDREKVVLGKSACYFNLINEDFKYYLYWVIKTKYFINYAIKRATGTTIKNVSLASMKEFLIPLPPLEEQKRIVAKIEELTPYVEKYDNAYSEVKELNKKFPDDMQKSILQYAIQGKLVEQREEEGTAEKLYQQIQKEKAKLTKEGKIKKEKPLSEITVDEIPFDIPENWKWVRFGNVMINRDAERVPLSLSKRESLEKNYDYYGASGVIDKVDDYIFDKKLMLIGEDGANLLTRSKPIAFIAEGKYWVNNHAHVIDCTDSIYLEYITYYINAISIAKYVTGTAQPKMNQAKLNTIPVPLPPLEEQKRIVEKIDELLPYTKQLVK